MICARNVRHWPRLYVSFPLALAAAIGLELGDEVQWELLDRGELHLVRLSPSLPAANRVPELSVRLCLDRFHFFYRFSFAVSGEINRWPNFSAN